MRNSNILFRAILPIRKKNTTIALIAKIIAKKSNAVELSQSQLHAFSSYTSNLLKVMQFYPIDTKTNHDIRQKGSITTTKAHWRFISKYNQT